MSASDDLAARLTALDRYPVEDDPATGAMPLAPVPAWPAGILPDDLERYAVAQAASIGVPPEMVAVPLLVFAGGVAGNVIRLQLKSGWSVSPVLWAGVVGDPAAKKSPSLQGAQWPVSRLQDVLFKAWQAEYEAWQNDTDAKGKTIGFPPALEHVFTTDATMEALVRILASNRGVNVIRDELSGFIGGMDKYRKTGDDRQNYLSLWAGAPIKVDRVTGGTAYVSRPVAGIYGGIQPDRARDLHTKDGARDGMVERFLLFWPDVARSGWSDASVDPALIEPVAVIYAKLRRFKAPDDGEVITVRLSRDAKGAFVDWFNANDAALGRVSGLRQGFYGKLDAQLARIALILHCLHNPDDPRPMLSLATMEAAIEVAEFFRGHLDRVLPLIGDLSTGEPVGLPGRILRILRMPPVRDPDGWVSRSVVYARLRNVSADALTGALRGLERDGLAESRTLATATNPAEQWRIAPLPHTSYSQDSQDSPAWGPPDPNLANNANLKNRNAPPDRPLLRSPTGTDGVPETVW